MPFSSDSFMIEKPYNVKLMPPPVSEAGLGKQLPERKANRKRGKPTATAILNVRFLIRHRAFLFRRDLRAATAAFGCGGYWSIPYLSLFWKDQRESAYHVSCLSNFNGWRI